MTREMVRGTGEVIMLSELREIRLRRGFPTLRKLEQALSHAVSDATLGNWENGKTVPGGAHLLMYARTLGLTPEEVLRYIAEAKAQREAAG